MADAPSGPGLPGAGDELETLDNLAGQALENLVNQFARPLDFLRELVQNSIDAGSPRVEIWLAFHEDPQSADPGVAATTGVLEVHVDDWGEGMDEGIIDKQLTRLFSSTKEDDLTKIGKFGIGFTSIFAIRPDAVLLRTGRHGESWELLFHADRSFDKVRIDDPIAGTRITLFKRMPATEVDDFVRESRWILGFWCEHSDTPVTFWDRTRQDEQQAPATADPFAAFQGAQTAPAADDAPRGPEQVNSPMGLDVDLAVQGSLDGVQVVAGYSPRPRYGFYNGGLTLMNTENDEVLGQYMHQLGHLSFKVKSDALEHTLTRDNVLQDQNWERAIAALQQTSAQLQQALLDRCRQAVQDGEVLGIWHRYLARECRARALHRTVDGAMEVPVVRDHRGAGHSLSDLEAAYEEQGAVLLHPGAGPLADALDAEGILLFDDDPDLRDLLEATWRPPFFAFSNTQRRIVRADRLYVLPRRLSRSELGGSERQLVELCAELLSSSVDGRLDLEVAEFPSGADEALVVEGPDDAGVFRRSGRRWRWLPGVLHRRRLLLNRLSPYYLAQVVLAGERPRVASFALAQAILDTEGVEGNRTHVALAREIGRRLEAP